MGHRAPRGRSKRGPESALLVRSAPRRVCVRVFSSHVPWDYGTTVPNPGCPWAVLLPPSPLPSGTTPPSRPALPYPSVRRTLLPSPRIPSATSRTLPSAPPTSLTPPPTLPPPL